MGAITIRKLPLLLIVALQIAASTTEAATIYVDAKAKGRGAPDGMSWKTAFASLQDALDKAAGTPGSEEIWIAEGTYDLRADEDLRAKRRGRRCLRPRYGTPQHLRVSRSDSHLRWVCRR
jgi:hypothetical protein